MGDVKFIRKNGRIIPIKRSGSDKAKMVAAGAVAGASTTVLASTLTDTYRDAKKIRGMMSYGKDGVKKVSAFKAIKYSLDLPANMPKTKNAALIGAALGGVTMLAALSGKRKKK